MRVLILGVLTIIPSAYAVCFLALVVLGFLGILPPTFDFMRNLLLATAFVGVWSMCLGGFYAHHFLHNEKVPANKRTFWNAAQLFGNLDAMPRYWYKYFLHANDPPKAPQAERTAAEKNR